MYGFSAGVGNHPNPSVGGSLVRIADRVALLVEVLREADLQRPVGGRNAGRPSNLSEQIVGNPFALGRTEVGLELVAAANRRVRTFVDAREQLVEGLADRVGEDQRAGDERDAEDDRDRGEQESKLVGEEAA